MNQQLGVSKREIAAFCERWKIREFAFFGSVLREDFRPDSDLDILVAFSPEAQWSLLDHLQMEQELREMFGRSIDLFTKQAVEKSHNWIRRQEILNTLEVVHVT
jgi:hypothetical protein